MRLLAFALTALAALLIVDGLAGGQIYQAFKTFAGQPIRADLARRNVAQGAYLIAVLVWPAATLLKREGRQPMVVALIGGVVGATVLFGADAPALALVKGAAALALVAVFGRWAVLVLGGASAIYILAAPWVVAAAAGAGLFARAKAYLPASWDQRLDIWAFAAARVCERPLIGWGLDASRTWKGVLPLHTHDAALQIWLELGGVGAVLASAFVVFLFWVISRAREGVGYMGTASATLVAYLTIGAISFGVWQEWWLATGALALCACAALKQAMAYWMEDERLRVDRGLPTLP